MQHTRIDNAVVGRGPCRPDHRTGFTLLEVMTALAILALVSSSVLVVVDRCLESTADSLLRIEAFELARENMEKLLSAATVEETVEYGNSEKYPDISWQTVVESFAEPVSGKMWIRAVCSANYRDSTGEEQTMKLEHWITELTDQQANQLAGQPGSIEELTADQVLATPEAAAEYAGVDTDTIENWVDGGLVAMKDGTFIKYNLDVFIRNDGKPSSADKRSQVKSIEDLAAMLKSQQGDSGQATDQTSSPDGKDRLTGVPQQQLDKMGVGDVMKMLKDKNK